MKKILWATDFSAHAHDAGLRILECARHGEGPIDVLTVVDPDEVPLILLDAPDPFIAAEAVHEAERQALLRGSTIERVTRRAECPVMVLR